MQRDKSSISMAPKSSNEIISIFCNLRMVMSYVWTAPFKSSLLRYQSIFSLQIIWIKCWSRLQVASHHSGSGDELVSGTVGRSVHRNSAEALVSVHVEGLAVWNHFVFSNQSGIVVHYWAGPFHPPSIAATLPITMSTRGVIRLHKSDTEYGMPFFILLTKVYIYKVSATPNSFHILSSIGAWPATRWLILDVSTST